MRVALSVLTALAAAPAGAQATDPANAATAETAEPAATVESLTAIRGVAETYVRSLVPATARDVAIAVGGLDSRLRLAPCASRNLSASLPAGMNLQARSTVGVSCAEPVHWTVYVPVSVESTVDVLVLSHAVQRDARLTTADVTVESRRTPGPGSALLSAPKELQGRTVRRALPAGTVLGVDMFSIDYVVRRGQQVTLLSSGGSIEVRAVGRAMADAGTGARIQVENLSSQRIVEGVVESPDLVRIARQ